MATLPAQVARLRSTAATTADVAAALGEIAVLRQDLEEARLAIAQAQADLHTVKTALDAHAANNGRHTGPPIGGLL